MWNAKCESKFHEWMYHIRSALCIVFWSRGIHKQKWQKYRNEDENEEMNWYRWLTTGHVISNHWHTDWSLRKIKWSNSDMYDCVFITFPYYLNIIIITFYSDYFQLKVQSLEIGWILRKGICVITLDSKIFQLV